MKKTSLLLSLILTLVASSAFAQNKLFTLEEIYGVEKGQRVQFGGTPTFAQWTADGKSFLQVKDQGAKFVRVDPKTGAETEMASRAEVASALSKIGLPEADAKMTANYFGFAFNENQTLALLNNEKDLFVYDLNAKTAKRLTNNDAAELEADFSPDAKYVSFVRGMNLFVVDTATGKETQFTRDGSDKFLNGYLDWVYEEELYGRGNKRGYFWSPDSTAIAFLRTDETPVKNFVVVEHTAGEYQRVEDTPYPKAGAPNPIVKVGIANVSNGAVTFVDTTNYKPEDFLVVRIGWSGDSKRIIYQAQNREQTFLDLNAVDRNSGKATLLFQEKSPAWVEVIDNPTFLADGSFVWSSAARTGFKHLYHFDANGKLIRPLTTGEWEANLEGIDEQNGFAYFSGSKDGQINSNVYRVKLAGGEVQRLSKGDGAHNASFNADFTHYIEYFSDINTPTQTRLFKADGTLEKVINENKTDVFSKYKTSKPEFLKVKTRDGFEMEAMRILPTDFDKSKKYPVMQFTYAGPHAPQVVNRWQGSNMAYYQMLAQKGYIVWVCDNRTASGKGAKSEYAAFKNFGESELRDIEDGLNFLKKESYADASRIGIYGWSYGGFMTSYALTHSKSFKMGIAGGSVTDWALYDSIYTERYMGTPQNNPEGYAKSSVLKAAKDLNGKILLIHGTIDDNVHLQNTMQLIYELQKAGKQFEFVPYPTQRHGVSDARLNLHLRQKMTDFIMANL